MQYSTPATVVPYLQQVNLPQPQSHKGQNGKLLIIGGSQLFHAASKWSLDIASKFVDMVFYASVPSNNELVREAKQNFWNGIVIERTDIESYLEEADAILIGPGMERSSQGPTEPSLTNTPSSPTQDQWNTDTEKITNYLVSKYPDKKWVIDAGALQMINPAYLTSSCIITPHPKEAAMLVDKLQQKNNSVTQSIEIQNLASTLSCTIVLKGPVDTIVSDHQTFSIPGGNPGMTKGGTGDVLAGLIAALYCTNPALTAAIVGSYINKKAGENLSQNVGPFFNSSDLVEIIPETLWQEWQVAHNSITDKSGT